MRDLDIYRLIPLAAMSPLASVALGCGSTDDSSAVQESAPTEEEVFREECRQFANCWEAPPAYYGYEPRTAEEEYESCVDERLYYFEGWTEIAGEGCGQAYFEAHLCALESMPDDCDADTRAAWDEACGDEIEAFYDVCPIGTGGS